MTVKIFQSVRGLLLSGPNRIALSAAVRGTIAMAAPFLGFRLLGHPVEAVFAGMAALNVSIAGLSGPYRTRLNAMGATVLVMPFVVFAGTQVRGIWWLDVGMMFVVAFLGGLARTLGQVGVSLGLISSLIFLIGLHIPGSVTQSAARSGAYFAGGAWTVLLTVVLWKLRPYKRVELEVAASLSETAGLVDAARKLCFISQELVRECEQGLSIRHRNVRSAIEEARTALGQEVSSDSEDGSASMFSVLLSSVSEISGAVLHLGEILASEILQSEPEGLRATLDGILEEFERGCRALNAALIERKGNLDLAPARERVDSLKRFIRQRREKQTGTEPLDIEGILSAVNRTLRSLENALEAAGRLLGGRRRTEGLLPPLHPAPAEGRLETFRSNLTFDSIVFRHALRVALTTSAGTAFYVLYDLPNGVWIPLTILIVLQPKFGATFERAIHRTAGTLLGAGLASLAVLALKGAPGMEVAIIAAMFGTLLFFRIYYGAAVVFLTVYIILLLDLVLHQPWTEVIDRVRDTALGAAIALASGYLLWPIWEKRDLPGQFAAAVRANREYLKGVLDALKVGRSTDGNLDELRRKAEIEAGNDEAAFERMQAEPARSRLPAEPAFSLATLIRRLNRHATELAIHLTEMPRGLPEVENLAEALDNALGKSEKAVAELGSPDPLPDLDRAYEQVRSALVDRRIRPDPKEKALDRPQPRSIRTTLAFLLDRIVGDAKDLRAAVERLSASSRAS